MIVDVESKVEAKEAPHQINPEQLISRLAFLEQQMLQAGDQLNANKIKQLMHKVYMKHFTIAFCGHFSAGKSSLINHLFADDVLPTSPIPTSANIVKVKSGESLAAVTYKDGKRYEFHPPFNIEEIKSYCLDGDAIELVEIQHPNTNIPSNVSIMDTPGIDSTDDAHRLATESILHLADVLFYVMDYNHVQSELNLNFTKLITDRQIKLYLVINQIDKHRESELPFTQFKAGVGAAFTQWNVVPENIFFISLKDGCGPINQLQALKSEIEALYKDNVHYINRNSIIAAQYIIDDHLHWLKENQYAQSDGDHIEYSSLTTEEIEELGMSYRESMERLHQLEMAPIHLEDQLNDQVQKILYNSSLMPYDTRQLAQHFLESTQPKFKVGLIFTDKKTEEERTRRLNELYTDLKDKVAAQIDWHIKTLLQQLISSYNIKDERLIQSIYDMEVVIGTDVILKAVKKEAQLSGDYLLNYAKDVSESIKQIYRRVTLAKLEELKKTIIEQSQLETRQLQEKIQSLDKQFKAIKHIEQLNNQLDEQKRYLLQILSGEVDQAILVEARQLADFSVLNKVTHTINGETNKITKTLNTTIDVTADLQLEPQKVNQMDATTKYNLAQKLNNAAMKLRTAANIVADMIGFNNDAKEMLQKAERLEQNRFTVSLFGAFSAGKSSFANALMGEKLLPTSPNPTTAAITKILPPTDQYAHGTIRVKVKNKSDLYNDLTQSLQVFDLQLNNIEEAPILIAKVNHEQLTSKAKPHYSFIKAFEKGYQQFADQFDRVIEAHISQLEPFVAQEDQAAFIEWIEIYYHNQLTEQGITLVDTPGADSIHSRHTGVAFEYIKNADALIYVTYYNHAFSQADQLFLSQLGRVKEAFELDKMFFIVNAIDLATSREEIALVKNHVEQNLLASGVRMPRIYPVSSKQALEAKLIATSNNSLSSHDSTLIASGFPQFEYDFIQFTLSELVDVAINAATLDMNRSLQKLVGYISASEAGEENRKKQLERVNDVHQRVRTKIKQVDLYNHERAVVQEIEELMYYVKQRLNLRQRDNFKIAFSPAVLRKDVSDIKHVLKSALVEWLIALQVEMLQELRATVIRIEKFLGNVCTRILNLTVEDIQLLDQTVVISPHSIPEISTPKIDEEQLLLQTEPFVSQLSKYKNQKQFFEQGGNQEMLEGLLTQLQNPLNETIEQLEQQFQQYYQQILQRIATEVISHIHDQVEEYYDGVIAALSMKMDIQTLQDKYQKLQQAIHAEG